MVLLYLCISLALPYFVPGNLNPPAHVSSLPPFNFGQHLRSCSETDGSPRSKYPDRREEGCARSGIARTRSASLHERSLPQRGSWSVGGNSGPSIWAPTLLGDDRGHGTSEAQAVAYVVVTEGRYRRILAHRFPVFTQPAGCLTPERCDRVLAQTCSWLTVTATPILSLKRKKKYSLSTNSLRTLNSMTLLGLFFSSWSRKRQTPGPTVPDGQRSV